MTEIWKDIPGYEGQYQASNLGRVRSVARSKTCYFKDGRRQVRNYKSRVLKPAGNKYNPHLYVVLGHGKNGSPVHYLVALAFHGERPKKADVRHLDNNPLNNRADNLAYGTRTENILDKYNDGGRWRKLTIENVKEIRRRHENGEHRKQIIADFNICESHFYNIVGRRGCYEWLD